MESCDATRLNTIVRLRRVHTQTRILNGPSGCSSLCRLTQPSGTLTAVFFLEWFTIVLSYHRVIDRHVHLYTKAENKSKILLKGNTELPNNQQLQLQQCDLLTSWPSSFCCWNRPILFDDKRWCSLYIFCKLSHCGMQTRSRRFFKSVFVERKSFMKKSHCSSINWLQYWWVGRPQEIS